MHPKVLITGGSGYLGPWLVQQLQQSCLVRLVAAAKHLCCTMGDACRTACTAAQESEANPDLQNPAAWHTSHKGQDMGQDVGQPLVGPHG